MKTKIIATVDNKKQKLLTDFGSFKPQIKSDNDDTMEMDLTLEISKELFLSETISTPFHPQLKITKNNYEYTKTVNFGFAKHKHDRIAFACFIGTCRYKSRNIVDFAHHLMFFHHGDDKKLVSGTCGFENCQFICNKSLMLEYHHLLQHVQGRSRAFSESLKIINKNQSRLATINEEESENLEPFPTTTDNDFYDEFKDPLKHANQKSSPMKINENNNLIEILDIDMLSKSFLEVIETPSKKSKVEKKKVKSRELKNLVTENHQKNIERMCKKAAKEQINEMKKRTRRNSIDITYKIHKQMQPENHRITRNSAVKDIVTKITARKSTASFQAKRSMSTDHLPKYLVLEHEIAESNFIKSMQKKTDDDVEIQNYDIDKDMTMLLVEDDDKISNKIKREAIEIKTAPVSRKRSHEMMTTIKEEPMKNSSKKSRLSVEVTSEKVNVIKLYPWIEEETTSTIMKTQASIDILMSRNCLFSSFKCMREDCTYFTTSLNDFRTHSALHLDDNNHICSFCLLKFSKSNLLCDHINNLHMNDRFQCNQCMYRACQVSYVDLHQKMFHKKVKNCEIFRSPVQKFMKTELTKTIDGLAKNRESFVRAYKCRTINCKRVFFSKNNFRSHLSDESKELKNMASRIMEQLYEIDHAKVKEPLEGHVQCLFCRFGTDGDDILVHLMMKHPNKIAFACYRKGRKCEENETLESHTVIDSVVKEKNKDKIIAVNYEGDLELLRMDCKPKNKKV
jgi:hypothetical protein